MIGVKSMTDEQTHINEIREWSKFADTPMRKASKWALGAIERLRTENADLKNKLERESTEELTGNHGKLNERDSVTKESIPAIQRKARVAKMKNMIYPHIQRWDCEDDGDTEDWEPSPWVGGNFVLFEDHQKIVLDLMKQIESLKKGRCNEG